MDTTIDKMKEMIRKGDAETVLAVLRHTLSEQELMSYMDDPLFDHLQAASHLLRERYRVRDLSAGSQSS